MPIVVLKVELAVGQSEIIPDVRHIIARDWTELMHIAAHEGSTKLTPVLLIIEWPAPSSGQIF